MTTEKGDARLKAHITHHDATTGAPTTMTVEDEIVDVEVNEHGVLKVVGYDRDGNIGRVVVKNTHFWHGVDVPEGADPEVQAYVTAREAQQARRPSGAR